MSERVVAESRRGRGHPATTWPGSSRCCAGSSPPASAPTRRPRTSSRRRSCASWRRATGSSRGCSSPTPSPRSATSSRRMWRQQDRSARNQHRAHDPSEPEQAEDLVVASEEHAAMARAVGTLDRRGAPRPAGPRGRRPRHPLPRRGRRQHGGGRRGVSSSAPGRGCGSSTSWRSSSRSSPPRGAGPCCSSLSGADRRRQGEVGAAQHLLECALCARLSEPLLGRGPVRDDRRHRADHRGPRHRRGPPGPPASSPCGPASPGRT